jgi:molybdate transport system ATP-binding protein
MIKLFVQKKLFGADGAFTLNIETSIERGELVTIYGPTGSGKSSLLKIIAGLMNPDGGRIESFDKAWYDSNKKVNITPQERNIGIVFQDYSLFPNMTVRENLEFALQKNQDKKIVDELLDITQLTNMQNVRPARLSGGQKQRVALTRALVRKPNVLLLDEPLSALDAAMREKLQNHIVDFHNRFGLTTILVSHDFPEILKMSKRVLVLENGAITRDCMPNALF